jgi:hypothetical protein
MLFFCMNKVKYIHSGGIDCSHVITRNKGNRTHPPSWIHLARIRVKFVYGGFYAPIIVVTDYVCQLILDPSEYIGLN